MRWHPVWGFVLFLLAMLAAGSLANAAERSPSGYETRTVEGFTVYVSQAVAARQNDGFGRRPIDVVQKELNDLKRILKPRIVEVLQTVPIWVEWDRQDELSPNAVARYYGGAAEGLAKLGGDPRKANCVEILTLRRLAEIRSPGTALQQIIVLHEMAHVVHHRLLGWDNPELAATFQAAVDRKLYDEVNDRFARRGPAYARTNAAEYFAELSCAYLDSCNFFPFNQQQLRGYDSQGFQFVERVWQEPERFRAMAGKPGVARAVTRAVPRVSIEAERDATMKLDKIKNLIRTGSPDSARTELQLLVRAFPGTEAAGEATELLRSLKP